METLFRLMLWRPVQEVVFAWRFWTALRSAQHDDWRDRTAWAAALMLTRALKTQGYALPLSVQLTESNAGNVLANAKDPPPG